MTTDLYSEILKYEEGPSLKLNAMKSEFFKIQKLHLGFTNLYRGTIDIARAMMGGNGVSLFVLDLKFAGVCSDGYIFFSFFRLTHYS